MIDSDARIRDFAAAMARHFIGEGKVEAELNEPCATCLRLARRFYDAAYQEGGRLSRPDSAPVRATGEDQAPP